MPEEGYQSLRVTEFSDVMNRGFPFDLLVS